MNKKSEALILAGICLLISDPRSLDYNDRKEYLDKVSEHLNPKQEDKTYEASL